MKAGDLLGAFRAQLFDTREPYLWSKDDFLGYLNEAQNTLVRFIGGLLDATSAHTRIDVVAGTYLYPADPLTLRVESANYLSDNQDLSLLSFTTTPPRPDLTDRAKALILDYDDRHYALSTVPALDDTLQLRLYRLPEPVTGLDSELELRDAWRDGLLYGCRALAHLKPDPETYDRGAADRLQQRFDEALRDIRREMDRQRGSVRVVHYGGL